MILRVLVVCLLITLLAACSGPVQRPPMDIGSFNLVATLALPKPVQKALYEPFGETLYALNAQDQEITLYNKAMQKNVIGGLGTGETNFLRLSDIALAPAGGVLALDQAAKTVKKFDANGKFLSSLDLAGAIQPALIAQGADQLLYVFDQASSEIIVYSMLDGTEQNRFGKFELKTLTLLSCNRDYVVGYDASTDTSHVFSSLGQFVKSEAGQTLYDDYNNGINLRTSALTSQMSPAFLPADDMGGLMTISGDMLVMARDSEVHMLKIEYLQVN